MVFLLLLVYIGKLVSINVVCGVVIILLCQVKKRYFGNFKTNLLYGGKFVQSLLYKVKELWTKNPPKNKQEKHNIEQHKNIKKKLIQFEQLNQHFSLKFCWYL